MIKVKKSVNLGEIKISSKTPNQLNPISIGLCIDGEYVLIISNIEQDNTKASIEMNQHQIYSFLDGKQTLYQAILKSKKITTSNGEITKKYSQFRFIEKYKIDIHLKLGDVLKTVKSELELL